MSSRGASAYNLYFDPLCRVAIFVEDAAGDDSTALQAETQVRDLLARYQRKCLQRIAGCVLRVSLGDIAVMLSLKVVLTRQNGCD